MTLGIVVWAFLVLAFLFSVVGWWRAQYGVERDSWLAPVIAFGVFSLMPLVLWALQRVSGVQ